MLLDNMPPILVRGIFQLVLIISRFMERGEVLWRVHFTASRYTPLKPYATALDIRRRYFCLSFTSRMFRRWHVFDAAEFISALGCRLSYPRRCEFLDI